MSSPHLAISPPPDWESELAQRETGDPREAPTFDSIYETWFDEVTRWVRALGGADADLDDLVQDVFLVVHRRLPDFDGSNVAGWLYQIARHRVRDYRRSAWFRHLVYGRGDLGAGVQSTGRGPAENLEHKQRMRLLERVLARLNDDQRAAFVLFEIEGLSGEQIAALQGAPVNTVWARIHKARKKLRLELARLESTDDGGGR